MYLWTLLSKPNRHKTLTTAPPAASSIAARMAALEGADPMLDDDSPRADPPLPPPAPATLDDFKALLAAQEARFNMQFELYKQQQRGYGNKPIP